MTKQLPIVGAVINDITTDSRKSRVMGIGPQLKQSMLDELATAENNLSDLPTVLDQRDWMLAVRDSEATSYSVADYITTVGQMRAAGYDAVDIASIPTSNGTRWYVLRDDTVNHKSLIEVFDENFTYLRVISFDPYTDFGDLLSLDIDDNTDGRDPIFTVVGTSAIWIGRHSNSIFIPDSLIEVATLGLPADFVSASSVDDVVYALTEDGMVSTIAAGAAAATPILQLDDPANAPFTGLTVIDNEMAVIADGGATVQHYYYDTTDKVWRYEASFSSPSASTTSAITFGAQELIGTTTSGVIYAYSLATHELLWESDINAATTGPAIDGVAVVSLPDGYLTTAGDKLVKIQPLVLVQTEKTITYLREKEVPDGWLEVHDDFFCAACNQALLKWDSKMLKATIDVNDDDKLPDTIWVNLRRMTPEEMMAAEAAKNKAEAAATSAVSNPQIGGDTRVVFNPNATVYSGGGPIIWTGVDNRDLTIDSAPRYSSFDAANGVWYIVNASRLSAGEALNIQLPIGDTKSFLRISDVGGVVDSPFIRITPAPGQKINGESAAYVLQNKYDQITLQWSDVKEIGWTFTAVSGNI